LRGLASSFPGCGLAFHLQSAKRHFPFALLFQGREALGELTKMSRFFFHRAFPFACFFTARLPALNQGAFLNKAK
jgi:hypothetical protein